MAAVEKGFGKGLWTGVTTAAAACFAIYMFFLTDDPRVSRLNNELATCGSEVKELRDSVAALGSLGIEVARFEVPCGKTTYNIAFWGDKIDGFIDADGCPDVINAQLVIDTCKGRVFELQNRRHELQSCAERFDFDLRRGNYAPVGVAEAQFLIQFVGMRDSMAVVRLIKIPDS